MNSRTALVLAAALACGQAMAADAARADARNVYQQEKAECVSGTTNQTEADCMKEARNAAADAKKGQLETPANVQANARARCEALPASDKADCLKRMDEGAVIGDPKSGGVLREHREVVVGDPKP